MSLNKKNTILVVEDEIFLLEMIIGELVSSGFNIVSCRTVKQAKNLMQDIPDIHAVWLDHYLPGANGLEFVRYLRRSHKWDGLPVFVVSNTSDQEVADLYKTHGAHHFYTKVRTPLSDIAKDIKECLDDSTKKN